MTTPTRPLDVLFCVPGLPFNGDTIKTNSLGGSESAAVYLMRELAKRGHRVRAFTNTNDEWKPGVYDGVTYLPFQQFLGYATQSPSDGVVIQRIPEVLGQTFFTKATVLWCHDLALKRHAPVYRATQWQTDRVAVLSQFMLDQYKEVLGLEPPLLWKTRNGVDPSLIGRKITPWAERDRDLILYCARPERGLDRLVDEVFPEILQLRPTARLGLCTYDNPVPQPWLEELKVRLAKLPHENFGALSKDHLYDLMSRAGAYVYPTPGKVSPLFREISCIAAMEAQACGLPFISSGEGALSETAPHGGRFVSDDAAKNMARAVCETLDREDAYLQCQNVQIAHIRQQRYDWASIAADWEAMFYETIERKNDDPVRLASHFYRHSEIEGAERALAKAPHDHPMASNLRQLIARKYAFRWSDETYASHYAAMGGDTDGDLTWKDKAGMFSKEWITTNPEARFKFMHDVLKEAGVKNVLDYGCGHGWSPLFMHNNLNIPVYGLDVDPGAIKWANRWADQFANEPARCQFTDDERAALDVWPQALGGGGYDSLVCSEVLEHVRDPAAFLEKGERAVKKGGLVVITVPFGPWEYGGPNWYTYRCHIREFSTGDLNDMLGKKPELRLGAVLQTHNPYTGEPQGFLMASYRADHEPLGAIDWGRKLKIQNPRQTLSVNMLIGPGAEKTVRWTLDSIAMIADELVVVNCGAPEAAVQACREYGAVIIDSEPPAQIGFDQARNKALDASHGDWILWIDSDERLTDPHELGRYLRANFLNGYTLDQVHLAIDAQIPKDTPVRLIRNKRGLRFFGHIHEHPETELNKGPGLVAMIATPRLAHVGYLSNPDRAGRFYRNRPLMDIDHKRHPERALGFHLEARDQVQYLNELLLRTNGEVGPQHVTIAEEVLRNVRAFEAMNIPLQGIDITQFKTVALRVLGRGFEATVDIKVGRDNVGDQGPLTMRFETAEEFNAYIEKMTKDKVDAVTGALW